MADASPVMIWTLDPEGNSTYYNKKAAEFTGHEEEQPKEGKSWQVAIHPEDIEFASGVVGNAVINRISYEMECRMQNARGEWRWLLNHGTPRFGNDGEYFGFVGSSVDITERKLAEDAVLYRKALLEAQNNAIPDAILIVDTKGAMISYNHHFAKLWNIPQEIIDAKDDAAALEFAMTQVTDPKAFIDRVTYCYEHPDESAHEEIIFVDGRIIERYGNAVMGDEGTNYGWIWYFRDITQQKQFTERLEKLVTERTKALQQSNDNLQQFAHVASHDLKEPVRKIRTFTSRLEDELHEGLNEKGKLYLDKVKKATERMFMMIDGVLTFSTVDASKQVVQTVDVNDVLKNIKTDLEVLIQETGARIFYNALPSVEGSSVLLYQLFYNLMNNAIKFARSGVPPVISIGSAVVNQEGREFAQILCNDNGIGFEQEQAEKIFETFTRLHSKDKYDGTGLGLSLCKRIVERHGGSIQAKGRLDEGATFVILLPLKQTSLGI
jgi:PAS domain S-box-containing protein